MSWLLRKFKLSEDGNTVAVSPTLSLNEVSTTTSNVSGNAVVGGNVVSSGDIKAGTGKKYYVGATAVLYIGATSVAPANKGVILIDVTNGKLYYSTGTTVNDWKEVQLAS